MAVEYNQEIKLDAKGEQVFDAFRQIDLYIGEIQKKISGIGLKTLKDATAWKFTLAENLSLLKQAQSDLRAFENQRQIRRRGFAQAEAELKKISAAEKQAEKQATTQKLVEAKVFYREKERLARQEASVEKQLAKEVADYEASQDRQAARSARELALARKEAALAAVTTKAKSITSSETAISAKAESDRRLAQLRREREAMASNDIEAARSLASRIQIEKALGAALDGTIRKLNQQAEAEERVKEAAESRFRNEQSRGSKLLASSDVGARADISGVRETAEYYKQEQIAAQEVYRATLKTVEATDEQRVAARQALETANARVTAANKLVSAEERAEAAAKRAAEQEARQEEITHRQSLGGRIGTAAKNTLLYGVVAGGGYAALNTMREAVQGVIELEDEFDRLQAISDSTDSQMQSLKSTIYGIGENSRYAIKDLVKISQTLAQAGVSADEMGSVLKSVTTLATASGSTPDSAVQLVTSALGAFQLQAGESARIADLMTAALNRTKLTVTQVGQAIQYAGATAYDENISLETLLATVGAVAQGGVKSGSTIGTGLRQFLVGLQTPTKKLQFELDKLGITQQDVNVKTRGLAAVLDTLKTKGFGASEAYDGLETRAAAFYLVAKNNTDVMDDLQLAFTEQGAAAVANERAMSSLAAQWQRFKNVMTEGLAENLSVPQRIIRDILKGISDAIDRSENLKQGLREGKYGKTSQALQSVNDDLSVGSVSGFFLQAQTSALNALDGQFWLGNKGWGDRWKDYIQGTNDATSTTEKFATAIKNAGAKVSEHSEKIVEVDKEMERLKLQQDDLIHNQTRAQTETVTLSSRFEGLSKYLGTTKNAYVDLINAMESYRGEESQFLSQAYAGQVAAQQKQNNLDTTQLRSTLATINGNSQLLGSLPPSLRAFISRPDAAQRIAQNNPDDAQARNAASQLADAANKVSKSNSDLGNVLNEAAQLAGGLAVGTRLAARGRVQARQANEDSTPVGVQALSIQSDVSARLEKMQGMPSAERTRAGNQLTKDINLRLRQYHSGYDRSTDPQYREVMQRSIDFLNEALSQVASAIKPTQEEVSQAKEDAAEQRRREAELRKRPLVTRSDIDAVVEGGGTNSVEQSAMGYRGVSQNSSTLKDLFDQANMKVDPKMTAWCAAFVNAVLATNGLPGTGSLAAQSFLKYGQATKTPEKGDLVIASRGAPGSGYGHVGFFEGYDSRGDVRVLGGNTKNQVGEMPVPRNRILGYRKIPGASSEEPGFGGYSIEGLSKADAQLKATAVANALKNAGIEANVSIDEKNKKLIVTIRPGERFSRDRSERATDHLNQSVLENQVRLNEKDLTDSLKNVAKASSKDAFDSAVKDAQGKLDAVAAAMRTAARGELANSGISELSPEGQAKMQQVEDSIAQLGTEFQEKLGDSIIKAAKVQMKAAQTAFDAALAPALGVQARAQGALTGLDAYSLRNQVPDYVKQLASNRVAAASEAADRQRYALLPGQISSTQDAIGSAKEKLGDLTDPAEIASVNEQITELTNQLKELMTTREALASQLGASGLLPQNFNEGLEQAIESYREVHSMNDSFSDSVIKNLGGAIDIVDQGLNGMFSSLNQGTRGALSAFGDMAKGMMHWMEQIAEKAIATKIMGLLFKVAGSVLHLVPETTSTGAGLEAFTPHFHGGPIHRLGGGEVSNGDVSQDSVNSKLARGEWVVQKSAVDSVGNQFMAKLNNHGAKALEGLQSMPSLDMHNHLESNIYVVQKDKVPQLGPNDVKVILTDDLMNGEAKKLVEHISKSTR